MAKSMAMAMAMASSVVTNSMTKFIVQGCLSLRVYVARVCFRFAKKENNSSEGDARQKMKQQQKCQQYVRN